MFDFSFSELMVVAVVALLVIGPEKLPKVARTVGAFAGRMQRYVAQVKEEINREVRFEELQQLQHEIQRSVAQQSSAVKDSIKETYKSISLENDSPQTNKPDKTPSKRVAKKLPSVEKTKMVNTDIASNTDSVKALTDSDEELNSKAPVDELKKKSDSTNSVALGQTENSQKKA